MNRDYVRHHKWLRAGIIFLVAVFVMHFCMMISPVLPIGKVNADENIVVNINAANPARVYNPGDIVTINITASNMSHITRFGPFEISYDSSRMDYLSISQPTILSAFTYTVDSEEAGKLFISAVNQSVEADIEAAQMQGDEFEDNSFSSEEEIILCSISFRVLMATTENIKVTLDSAGEARDSSMQDVSTTINNSSTSLLVTAGKSSDASLAFLSINGYTLTPEFSPEITDYSISVGRDESSVQVSATAANIWSVVTIYGNTNLKQGDNTISIDVTAQDGVNKMTYSIHVSKQEDYMTEGAGLLDYEGKIYTFVAFPADYYVPNGFVETTRTINGYSVPCLARDGVESVLVYVSDGENAPDFYVYNPTYITVIPYVPYSTSIVSSRVIFASDLPDKVKVPEGFTASTLHVQNAEIEGFANSEGIFICYMVDETGAGAFYRYNEGTGEFLEYLAVDKTETTVYRFFFHLFLFATAVEAVIIVLIVFIVRQNIVKRRNPRPKRV